MRIPVSKDDLNAGRITKISRALQKAFPEGSLGLMQAQNELAALLGYRDLHDLQSSAKNPAPATKDKWTRDQIRNAVAWKFSRRHGIDLSEAAIRVSRLHLNSLEVDGVTTEGAFERALEVGKLGAGFVTVLDELGYYVGSSWNSKTPDLLNAKVPGYKFAVFPDRRIVRWSRVEELVAMLPEDFSDDLLLEPRYKHFGDTSEREQHFIASEILPQAVEPLAIGVKQGQILPEGFEIMWIFSKAEADASHCLGRVLHNKVLGGIIPVVYDAHTDAIYEAIGELLCGRLLTAPHSEAKLAGLVAPIFAKRFNHGGHDLEKDTWTSHGEHLNLVQLPDTVRIQRESDFTALTGDVFVEGGQTYLRNKRWMEYADIPSILIQGEKYDPSEALLQNRTAAIPPVALSLVQWIDQICQIRFSSALNHLQSEKGVTQLTGMLSELVDVASFDRYCDALTDTYLPTRNEDDTEDVDYMVEERTQEIQAMKNLGQEVKTSCPFLTEFSDTSLGLMLYLAQDDCPSNYRGHIASVPAARNWNGISGLLQTMVYYAASCATGRKSPRGAEDGRALSYVLNQAYHSDDNLDIVDQYHQVQAFSGMLEDEKKSIQGIDAWRDSANAMEAVRRQGQYLSVGAPIPETKPKSLADHFMESRSLGFSTTVTQSISQVAQGLYP